MGKTNSYKDFLTDIANAIREKTGSDEPINAQDMADKIRNIIKPNLFNINDLKFVIYDTYPDGSQCFIDKKTNAFTITTKNVDFAYLERRNIYLLPETNKSYTLSFDYIWLSSDYSQTGIRVYSIDNDDNYSTVGTIDYANDKIGHMDIVLTPDIRAFSFGGWKYNGVIRFINVNLKNER